MTLTTNTTIASTDIKIFPAQWMASFAMCWVCAKLACSAMIDKARYGLKMLRIYAEFVSAKMIYLQSVWGFSIMQSKGKSVRHYNAAVKDCESSIALAVCIGYPNPAWPQALSVSGNRAIFINFLPKPFQKRRIYSRHVRLYHVGKDAGELITITYTEKE